MQSIADLLDSLPKRKVKLPADYYDTRLTASRDLAFTVSGIHQLDTLQAILDSLDSNLKAGGSFAAWKRQIDAGELMLGLPAHRKELIFRMHSQTAYAHGGCKNAQDNKHIRPYAMYSAVGDSRTRPSHLKWDKTVLPLDHPWWRTHSPPSGFGCRCSKITLTAKQAKALGITPEADIDHALPDEGWAYSPCEHYTRGEEQALDRKEGRYHPLLRGFVGGLMAGLAAVRRLLGGQ